MACFARSRLSNFTLSVSLSERVQLALAWVHSRGEDVFPIPGTRSARRVEENAAAAAIHLTPEEIAEIEAAVAGVAGARYDDGSLGSTFSARA